MKIGQSWAVFFDAGHTLLHPKRSVGSVYAEVAEHYGVQADAALLDAGFRSAWKELKVPASQDVGRDEKRWWKDVVREAWKGANGFEYLPFDDYFETVYNEFARPELWSVYPDVWDLLNWLREREIVCGILSNWDERLRPLLAGHQLEVYFDPLIISAEVGVSKPAPEIFKIAEKVVNAKCDKYLLVGDDEACDEAGAHGAGWSYFKVDRPGQNLDTLLADVQLNYKE